MSSVCQLNGTILYNVHVSGSSCCTSIVCQFVSIVQFDAPCTWATVRVACQCVPGYFMFMHIYTHTRTHAHTHTRTHTNPHTMPAHNIPHHNPARRSTSQHDTARHFTPHHDTTWHILHRLTCQPPDPTPRCLIGSLQLQANIGSGH
jgi:hypothetical protein